MRMLGGFLTAATVSLPAHGIGVGTVVDRLVGTYEADGQVTAFKETSPSGEYVPKHVAARQP